MKYFFCTFVNLVMLNGSFPFYWHVSIHLYSTHEVIKVSAVLPATVASTPWYIAFHTRLVNLNEMREFSGGS